MTRVLRSPGKYVQGPGSFTRLYEHIRDLGDRIFFLASPSGVGRSKGLIDQSLADQKDIFYMFETLQGECSKGEIQRLTKILTDTGCNVVAGIGGGKVLDTAKAIAYYTGIPMAILPTVASSDAPCSALSVLYDDNGVFDEYLFLKQSPQLVLVDTEVIVKAPARLLVAGMGDALATYFEARAVEQSGKNNQVAGKPTIAARTLAEQSYATLIADGLHAKLAAERQCVTQAVENIVEVNTYISGVGFESGGLGAAHAIQKGFTTIKEVDGLYHGEKVAYGVIMQLVMENAPEEELREVIGFCQSVGLPVTFADLGIPDVTEEQLWIAAEFASKPGMTMHNMPFEVTAADTFAAFVTTDALGKHYGGGCGCRH